MRIQEDSVALIHESWVLSDIFRGFFFYRFAAFILLRFVFPPYEESVRTVIATLAPVLMGLKEGCLCMWKSVCFIGMACDSQRCSDTRTFWRLLTVSIIWILGLCPCDQNLPHIMMGRRWFYRCQNGRLKIGRRSCSLRHFEVCGLNQTSCPFLMPVRPHFS